MIVMPDLDAVLAVTAETPDMQGELNLVWKYLLPAMHSDKLPANTEGDLQLKKALLSLALAPAQKSKISPSVNGTYQLEPNTLNFTTVTFHDNQLTLANATVSYPLEFGNGVWQAGMTQKPGPSLTAAAKEIRTMLFPAKVAGSYTWKDDHTLQLTLRYIESPHTEKFTCVFDGQTVTIHHSNSFEGAKETVLKGKRL